MPAQSTGPTYEEQMRLDAVKAEADRKARQQKSELGLPAFAEYDPTQPLTADAEHEPQSRVPYRDAQYAAAPVGTRAVDEYYAAGNNANAYPPRRQPTTSSVYTQQTGYAPSQRSASGYAPSTYAGAAVVSAGPPVLGGYLNADNVGRQHEQYPSDASARYGQEQYATHNVGHRRASRDGQSTYSCRSLLTGFFTTAIHRSHAAADPFRAYTSPQTQPHLDPSTYNATARFSPPPLPSSTQPYASPTEPTSSYYTPQVQTAAPPSQSRSYALGGGGYVDSTLPTLHDPRMSANSGGYLPYPGDAMTQSSGSVYAGIESPPISPRGSRDPVLRALGPIEYEDSPPMYEDNVGVGTSHTTAISGKR
jgi:hypothetical protein